jgi:HK97 family phage portal protein
LSFLNRIVRGVESRQTSGLSFPTEWLTSMFTSNASFTGENVTVTKALGLAPVWSAVSLIAETIGALPLKVYRDIDDDNRQEARQHRAWRMLHDMPNPATTAHRFWATAAAHYLLWGNVYIEKLRNEMGLVEELWLRDPASIVVKYDFNTHIKTFFQDTIEGRKTWGEGEMLHILGFSMDGIIGISPISMVKESMGSALARERFEGKFYSRGGTLPGTLEHPAGLSQQAQQNLKADFKKILAAGEWAVLEEGMKANQLSMPLADMEFVASKQLSRTDIALIFHLPPAYLGGSTGDSLTYANVEQNQIQFAQFAVAPITNAIEKSIQQDPGIFPQSVFVPEFELKALLRGDAKTRSEFYKTLSEIKAITVNEVRGLENMPPVPDGDSLDLAPLPPVQDAQDTTAPEGAVSLPLTGSG